MSKMQTRDKAEEKRDLELENIVGNLLIAEYQVDKLRTRLTELVSGYRVQMNKNKVSTPLFHSIMHKIFPAVLLTTLDHLLHESERQHNRY
jgi:hypothetical protein